MSRTRTVLWSPWDGPGLEQLRLDIAEKGIVVDSLVIGVEDGEAFRLRYRIRCDSGWRVRALDVDPLDGRAPLALRADGEGNWTDGDGAPLAALAGCIDIDISATPFTNALPIRRLSLAPGERTDLSMVYLRVPALDVETDGQGYTRLESRTGDDRYLYESLDSDFRAVLPVDADDLVIDYPGLFRRIA